MLYPLYRPFDSSPWPKYAWLKVRMRHETEKAVLVMVEDEKIWLPKSRIRKVKLKKGWFWIDVRVN